jgi:hypothetical protein
MAVAGERYGSGSSATQRDFSVGIDRETRPPYPNGPVEVREHDNGGAIFGERGLCAIDAHIKIGRTRDGDVSIQAELDLAFGNVEIGGAGTASPKRPRSTEVLLTFAGALSVFLSERYGADGANCEDEQAENGKSLLPYGVSFWWIEVHLEGQVCGDCVVAVRC